jgi:hypothetical protein
MAKVLNGKGPWARYLPDEIIKFLADTSHDLMFTLFQVMA